ncbi:sphingosine kinase 1-like isoform X2 [Salvia miltiorrhiza]|uniref:sphingosine kinase 1-like isoform X2 n=1 Tax=Salvia miltiorrhiza TaxID=226208 RepID=UPI0025ABD370|nr:sphingosine kinase 1-like isoform X2 [Salvia miltiorrhiza]
MALLNGRAVLHFCLRCSCPISKLEETKHQLHAKKVAQSLDLEKFDGIVCVSGDGILVEAYQVELELMVVRLEKENEQLLKQKGEH